MQLWSASAHDGISPAYLVVYNAGINQRIGLLGNDRTAIRGGAGLVRGDAASVIVLACCMRSGRRK